MLIKAGVDISRLNREIRRALGKIDSYFSTLGEELIVTSTYEGNHGAGSLHYGNDAFECRPTTTSIIGLKGILYGLLGPDFDIVEEVDHIHIEYDPKGK